MPVLYVYEPSERAFSLHTLSGDAQMPHVRRFFFPVTDFFAGAGSLVGWTDARALCALDAIARQYPAPFRVRAAFRRTPNSVRSTGLCFSLCSHEPDALRAACVASGLFERVSPPFHGGASVDVTARCEQDDNCGVQVFALQNRLLSMGLFPGPLSGRRCAETRRACARLTNAPADATIRKTADLR